MNKKVMRMTERNTDEFIGTEVHQVTEFAVTFQSTEL